MRNPIQQHLQIDAVKKVAHQFLGMEQFSLVALLMVAGFFLGAGWLPDAGTNLLLPGGARLVGWCQLAGSSVIFILFGFLIRYKIKEQQQVRIVASSPPSARILIVFLSRCNQPLCGKAPQSGRIPELNELEGTNWEMPLLAIRHHAERLEQLYVFTSAGESGSHHQFSVFYEIVASAYPQLKIIELTGEGTDFENMAEVHKELDRLYSQFDHLKSYGSDDIMLDITGGQKPNSIAGALATLAEGRRFQYVSTVNKKVLCYDLVIDNSETA